MGRRCFGVLLLGLGALAVVGVARADPALRAPDRLYHDYCSVCHGDKGDGQSRARRSLVPPPRDFTAPQAALDLSRERMVAAVRDGRPGTAMAAWGAQLSQAEIEAVVDYIQERFMRPMAGREASPGRALYASHCSVCHGDDGRGAVWATANMNPPPRDFTSARARSELTRERMVRSATYGRADTAMPGFGAQLAPADIEAIVDYVRGAFMEGVPTEAPATADVAGPGRAGADLSRPFPNALAGDAGRGEAFYQANCVACHGAAGDGRGPRAYFIVPKPRNFTHPAARHTLNRPALYDAIARGRVGTEMPAWRTVLDAQTIADVAEYVLQTFIAGAPVDEVPFERVSPSPAGPKPGAGG